MIGKLFLFWVCLCGLINAQEQTVEVIGKLERSEIYEGESVLYTVEVRNIKDSAEPLLGDLSQFEVQQAGQQSLNSSFIQYINGKVTKQENFGRAYNYLLTPKTTGILEIPAPVAEYKGEHFAGQAQRLKVIAPEEQDLVLLHIQTIPNSVYPLQPFAVELRIFVKKLPDRYADRDPVSITDPPSLQIPWVEADEDLQATSVSDWLNPYLNRSGNRGFTINQITTRGSVFTFEEPLAIFDLHGQQGLPDDVLGVQRLAGKAERYWVYKISRSLVALRAKNYRFGPVQLKGLFADGIKNNELSGKKIYAIGHAAYMDVKSVPEAGKPDSFTGGIGQFSISSEVVSQQARVGDPMTLTITLTGEGNLADIAAPELGLQKKFAEDFKIYEATSETRKDQRVFTYSIRPAHEQVKAVPAVPFAYFDVEREAYHIIHTDPIAIEVASASHLSSDDIISATRSDKLKPALEARGEGLFGNITDVSALRDETVPLQSYGTFIGVLILSYGGLLLFARLYYQRRENPLLVQRRKALAKAKQRFANATTQSLTPLRAGLIGFIADWQGMQEAGLTGKDIALILQKAGVSEELCARAEGFIAAIDHWQYGGGKQSENLMQEGEVILQELDIALRRRGR